MKNAVFAMVFSGILGMGAAGCGSSNSSDKPDTGGAGGAGGAGGGSDPMSQVCDKLETCQTLSTTMSGVTTAADCKQKGSALLTLAPASMLPQIEQMLNGCLAKTDCAEFTGCIKPLVAMIPTQ